MLRRGLAALQAAPCASSTPLCPLRCLRTRARLSTTTPRTAASRGPNLQWTRPAPLHALDRPQPWMGAYYTLRESDPTALRNREKLQQRARPVRGRFICQTLDKRQREEIEAREPWRAADFTRGDVLEVQYKPSVSEEVNAAIGLCIGRIHKGLGSSFRLLCRPDGVAVEYQFKLYSPLLQNIVLRSRPKRTPRRKKIYEHRETVSRLSLPLALAQQRVARQREGSFKTEGTFGKKGASSDPDA